MQIEILPIAERTRTGFHACLDAVAREEISRAGRSVASGAGRRFVRSVASNVAQFVAVGEGRVVGW